MYEYVVVDVVVVVGYVYFEVGYYVDFYEFWIEYEVECDEVGVFFFECGGVVFECFFGGIYVFFDCFGGMFDDFVYVCVEGVG